MAAANQVLDKAVSVVTGVAGRAARFARYAGGIAEGVPHRIMGGGAKADMDDVTLARKVESIVFRPAGAPRGKVDVNVVEGVVYLRGEAKNPTQVKTLEEAVRAIPEVRGVENLLHLPNTPAPTRADAPRKQQKARRTAPKSARPDAGRRTERVSTERQVAQAEPTPRESAARGAGRQAAPLGTDEGDETA